MRILLNITLLLLALSTDIFAQIDFLTLDKKTYNYYLVGDYNNLKNTSDTLISLGIDYYYLRMRLGILSFNKQLYSNAVNNFNKAIEFNSLDTVSREYIYYSYLLSGRADDARLYLGSLSSDKKNNNLKSIGQLHLSELYTGASATGFDVALYESNNLEYEAVKKSSTITAGFEYYFSPRYKMNVDYTYFQKSGTVYSASNPTGTDLAFTQNQAYIKLTRSVFPGWEVALFGHLAYCSDAIYVPMHGNAFSTSHKYSEFLGGAGILKKGWKFRTEVNLSFSNFSYSKQIRGEGYMTYLPFGNLKLYLTMGGMYQRDKYWGGTYQFNDEIGLKIFKSLWLESGIVKGNSYLYARNQGLIVNNSFRIPSSTIYGNIIILPVKHITLTITPYYTENHLYSWDLNAHTRTDKLTLNSFGSAIKLTYKIK